MVEGVWDRPGSEMGQLEFTSWGENGEWGAHLSEGWVGAIQNGEDRGPEPRGNESQRTGSASFPEREKVGQPWENSIRTDLPWNSIRLVSATDLDPLPRSPPLTSEISRLQSRESCQRRGNTGSSTRPSPPNVRRVHETSKRFSVSYEIVSSFFFFL